MTPLLAPKSRKKRGEARFAPQLEKTLQAYETASGAKLAPQSKSHLVTAAMCAGLAALAIPQLTDAEVVYTPTNQQLPSPVGNLQISLNNNGIPDVTLSVSASSHIGSGHHTFAGGVSAQGLNGGAIETSGGSVAANPMGQLIGSSDHFASKGGLAGCFSEVNVISNTHHFKASGKWRTAGPRYMGVKFLISGETHYGWVRLQGFNCSFSAPYLTGYAYESEANKPIDSGAKVEVPPPGDDKASLGALAAGANGISHWRTQSSSPQSSSDQK